MAGVSDGKMGPQAMISGTRVMQAVGIYSQQLAKWSLHFSKESKQHSQVDFQERVSEKHRAAAAAPFLSTIYNRTHKHFLRMYLDMECGPRGSQQYASGELTYKKLDIKERKSAGAQKRQISEKPKSTTSTESV